MTNPDSIHLSPDAGVAAAPRWLARAAAMIMACSALSGCARTLDNDPAPLGEVVGQMLMVGFRGETVTEETRSMLGEVRPGGVVLFDYDQPSKGEVVRNITSPPQLQALIAQLQETAATPLLIAVDAEGGYVNRLKPKYGFTVRVPSAQKLGAGPVEETAAAAGALADQLQALGINWNLAPVVDVNVDPESPAIGRWERSFGADPGRVAVHAEAFAQAHEARGIIPTLKHFPGHGSASGDSHLGVTDVTATYEQEAELAPYRQLLGPAYRGTVMTAHIVNRKLDASGRPATLSRAVMTELLRDRLGFDGVIVSDDMQMGAIVEEYGLEEAAVEAVDAGVDVIVLANQVGPYDLKNVYRVREAVLQAVADGSLSEERIRESAARVTALKREYGITE